MPMTQTSRTAAISAVWVVLGLGAATTAHAHIITVADLPAGYATARLMPPFPGGLVPAGSMIEMFLNVTNSSLFDARITAFDTSCFSGEYVTGDVTREFLARIENERSDGVRAQRLLDLPGGRTARAV